jgi:hypothetical protein
LSYDALDVGQHKSFIIGFIEGTLFPTWCFFVEWRCSLLGVVS